MAQQINATMSTKIALDLLSASESVKSLTAVVRSSQNAWKAQEAEMKSAGDAVGAAQAKYDGLGKSIEAQQSKIDALKAKQSELKGNTADVAQQFLKYQQQIDGATKQLASMQAQQDRAKQAMDYQKSGLAGLQQEYTAAARANQAYVTRLEAEGNQQEANKAKMEGYKSSIVNLNEQLAKQSAELDKIAAASGKDSDAWRTQKTRVDETATSLAKAKSSMTGLQAEMDKANPSIFDRIKSHIAGTKSEADKTKLSFKKMVSATAIGQTISNGWSEFSGTIKSTITQGIQLAEAGEQATRVWKTLGVSGKGAEQLVGQMRDLKSETNLSADQVSVLQKRFYGMTGNVDKTKALTLGVATLADKLRLSGDGASTFAKSLQRAFNNGKLTTGVLTRMENAAPGLGSALAKAGGVSETAFNSMVASGQISSKKLQDLIVKISKDSKSTFNDFGNTAEGATQRLKGAWQGVEATLAKPLVSVQSTGINSIVNVLKSSAVTSLFTSLGKAMAGVAQQASNLLNYVAQHQKDIGGIITSLGTIVKIFASAVWHTISGVISGIAKSMGLVSDNAKKASDPLKSMNSFLRNIAKNKSGIEFVAKALLGVYAAVKLMTTAQKALNFVMAANPYILLAGAIIAVGAALIALYQHNKKFKAFVDGIVKSVQNMWKGMQKWIGQIVKGWNNFWSSVGKGWNRFWNGISKSTDAAQKKQQKQQEAADKQAQKEWNGFWNDVGKGWTSFWNDVNKRNSSAQKQQQKQQDAANKQAQKDWNGFWNDVGKGWNGFWNDVNKKNSSAQQQQQKQQDAANKQIKKDWDSFWSNASNGWNNFWSDTLKNAKNGMNDTKSRIDSGNDSIHKGWDSFWSSTSENWNGFWGNVGKNAQSGMSTVRGWISDGNSKIDSGWRSMWSGIKSYFGSIWDGIKNDAENGMNAVINVINGAIGGINWVWEKFTGKDALRKLSHVHFANGGIVTQKMHLVMVNDGAGPDWKELYQLPNGQLGMSQQRNATGLLPEGTRVFNGKETKAIMKMAGVEHYDLGGVIGGVGKFFSGAWDKLEAVGDWLANPVGKVTDLIKSSISGISGGVEMFSNLASGVINKLTGSVVDWFKKELAKLQDTLGANPGGSGVQRWRPYVIQALKANGFDASDYQVAAWMRVIQRESNGNPKAINLWDSNAKAGIPSMGLVQTIGPTFNAYKFPGHNDVYNGYDDLLAGIHYMKAIYGSGSSAFARVSGPEGYANGGLITQPIHALVGEDGPETILPLTKTSRAWQLLGQAVTNINHGLGNGAVAESESSGTDDLGKKLDNIADLLTKLSFVLQVGDDQFYPKVAPKVKQYNDRKDRFNAYWKGGTV
ncbi:phage minor tail protein [Lacticaseibacillus casei DSM 20011 = JCM 1134 = ATCC 393]|uniref:Phage minor tail protein n=7 Tax=Lacticaseibacillus TaxID=2759736 RepID=A0AAD1ES37_LACCA|nr:phage minor tail protein [Lacticaseibacillus casei DSM 20011 = JCM 1134 = ATCC 393]